MRFDTTLDTRSVYSWVSPALTNFSNSFASAIGYDIFSTHREPSDKFFISFDLKIKDTSRSSKRKNFNRAVVASINKIFIATKNKEFVDFFLPLVRNREKEFIKDIITLVQFVIINLEQSLSAAKNIQLLDLILYFNTEIRERKWPFTKK